LRLEVSPFFFSSRRERKRKPTSFVPLSPSLSSSGARVGTKGYFVQPTVFSGVTNEMIIGREEVRPSSSFYLLFTNLELTSLFYFFSLSFACVRSSVLLLAFSSSPPKLRLSPLPTTPRTVLQLAYIRPTRHSFPGFRGSSRLELASKRSI